MSGAPAAAAPRRRRWFRRRGIDLADLAVNSFAAFLGVFIALMVQNWRDQRETTLKLREARDAIHDELADNRKRVGDKLVYLRLVEKNAVAVINGDLQPRSPFSEISDDALRRAAAKTSFKNACQTIPGYTGFPLPDLTHAAYDSAQGAGVLAKMDFAETRRIARAYAVQHTYGQAFDRQSFLFQRLFDTNDPYLCIVIAREEAYYSEDLLTAYSEYLDPAGTR